MYLFLGFFVFCIYIYISRILFFKIKSRKFIIKIIKIILIIIFLLFSESPSTKLGPIVKSLTKADQREFVRSREKLNYISNLEQGPPL